MARRILLAEDERLSRLGTQRVLERLGYDVVGVANGREAVEAEATGSFDAVIMDCQMPEMDGFKATVAIRRREAENGGDRTPIIGLSGRAMDGDREAALAKGMDGYLTKPFTVPELKTALEEWVGRHA
jgi:two-component system sensor histidine kinase/response regulator